MSICQLWLGKLIGSGVGVIFSLCCNVCNLVVWNSVSRCIILSPV